MAFVYKVNSNRRGVSMKYLKLIFGLIILLQIGHYSRVYSQCNLFVTANTYMKDTSFWNKIVLFFGRNYLAGSSLEEGYETIKKFHALGRKSTFDIVGEDSHTLKDADAILHTYKQIADDFYAEYGEEDVVSISLKPTGICAVNRHTFLPETPLNERLYAYGAYASKKGKRKISLDMEDSNYTDASIEAVRYSWRKGVPIGLVLQSRLNRTEHDIDTIFSENYPIPRHQLRVRIVIGVYVEPEDIATNDRQKAKERLVDRVGQLFDKGAYVEIATHDPDIIDRIINEIIIPRNISPDRFEFQFLKGVENGYMIEKKVMRRGYTVRYYLGIELKKFASVPYIKRRLSNNPAFIRHGIKNIWQQMINFFTGE